MHGCQLALLAWLNWKHSSLFAHGLVGCIAAVIGPVVVRCSQVCLPRRHLLQTPPWVTLTAELVRRLEEKDLGATLQSVLAV